MATTYNAHQAAHICGIHIRTLQRHAQELLDAGAWKDESGQWRIPLQVLRDIGMTPGQPRPGDTQPSTRKTQATDSDIDERPSDYTHAHAAELQEQVNIWRRRAEIAEALADERAHHLETATQALRALTAARSTEETPATPAATPAVASPPRHAAAPRHPFMALFRRTPLALRATFGHQSS